jgi:hypothetical protein
LLEVTGSSSTKLQSCIPGSIQGGGKTQCTVACALRWGIGLKVREELEENVASPIDVTIQNDATLRALEDLVATKFLVNVTSKFYIEGGGWGIAKHP